MVAPAPPSGVVNQVVGWVIVAGVVVYAGAAVAESIGLARGGGVAWRLSALADSLGLALLVTISVAAGVAVGLCFVAVGRAVRRRRAWGRVTALVLGIVSGCMGLVHPCILLPFIAYSAFTLVVLFSPQYAAEFA